ncbi:MAG TPA: FAD-binding oxidoreductase [Dongiaceae bacterium]|nr:FAD-binding oxidoreductase [Dongiaceae bacterium]
MPRLPTSTEDKPFWWRAAPRPVLPQATLPARADIAVIGSGITGLVAAIHLAKAGRHVAVFDQGEIGSGASSRNAGFVGRTLKYGFGDLQSKHGTAHAVTVYREMQLAFDSVAQTIAAFGIDCDYQTHGRLVLANTPKQYDEIVAEYRLRQQHLGNTFEAVDKSDLQREIASDRYYGGVVVPDMAALHPGKYHQGLFQAAQAAGVAFYPRTQIASLRRSGTTWQLAAADGAKIVAQQVLLATNGYSGRLFPWLQRRLIPFDAWMIATAELDPALMAKLLPAHRTYIDNNMNIDFLRRSPDGKRVLFGGKTGTKSTLPVMARRLAGELRAILPDLAATDIDDVWTGRCAATFDLLPHLGQIEGLHYAVGYCFAGVPMGTHFGRLIANRLLGEGAQTSVFADKPFPTMPLYTGNTWFVPAMMRYYDWKDGKRHAA